MRERDPLRLRRKAPHGLHIQADDFDPRESRTLAVARMRGIPVWMPDAPRGQAVRRACVVAAIVCGIVAYAALLRGLAS